MLNIRRAAFYSKLKPKVGNRGILAKTTSLRRAYASTLTLMTRI
jgi:hypothetical protein